MLVSDYFRDRQTWGHSVSFTPTGLLIYSAFSQLLLSRYYKIRKLNKRGYVIFSEMACRYVTVLNVFQI